MRFGMKVEAIPSTAEKWTDQYLTQWCAAKHGWYGPKGLPEESQVFENYSTIDRDSDAAYEKLDAWIVGIVDVVVDDIGKRNPAQKAALYKAYDIVSVYVFLRGNYDELLKEAKAQVQRGLRMRGVWLGE
jgi:hypothetical protein